MRQGDKFGMLTVRERIGNRMVDCRCDCGDLTVVHESNLHTGNTKSCGCIWKMNQVSYVEKHGLFHKYRSEYRSWRQMKNRCLNPNATVWSYYGGRGISICDEWINDFQKFMEDMGPKHGPEYSIERIDNNGGYSPDNCKWATKKEQACNRRKRSHYKITNLNPNVRRGELVPSSKLKEKDVVEIRSMILDGMPLSKIADSFSVSKGTISFIKQNKTWSHVA